MYVGVRSKENEGTGIHFICLFSVIFRNFRLHLNTLFLVTDIVKDVPTRTHTKTNKTNTFPGIILVSQNQIKKDCRQLLWITICILFNVYHKICRFCHLSCVCGGAKGVCLIGK